MGQYLKIDWAVVSWASPLRKKGSWSKSALLFPISSDSVLPRDYWLGRFLAL